MSDPKASPLERFSAAVDLALSLPQPVDIYRTILAGTPEVDDGIRAASYDTSKVTGGGGNSHPERMLETRHPGQFPSTDDDEWEQERGTWGRHGRDPRDELIRLRNATERILDSIAALNAECRDAGQPDTWDEALKDAHLLVQQGYLQAALDVDRDIDRWLDRFAWAVDTVRAVRDSWMPHDPAKGLAEQNHPWCRNHQRMTPPEPKERHTKMLCKWCYRHIEDLASAGLGAAVELQLDPGNWPSLAMLTAKHQGRARQYEREWQSWARSLGCDPAAILQTRQTKRTA